MGMAGARKLEELIVWQLACELRDGITKAVDAGSGRRDFDFKDQIISSSRSTVANIAEGFGHFRPRPFANYLMIARASLMETQNHVLGAGQKHFSRTDIKRFRSLIFQLLKGISRLVRYLRSCPPNIDFHDANL
jgi:four helix bundle protein